MDVPSIKSEVTLQVNGLEQPMNLDHDDLNLSDTADAQNSRSKTKNSGRQSKWKEAYDQCRKYNQHWEEIFPWVQESENGKPFCQWCGVLIIPKKHALAQHHKSMRHRANAEMFQESGVLQSDPGVGSINSMPSMPSIELLGSDSHTEFNSENGQAIDYLDDSVDQENTPTPVKKKRGRKPKSASNIGPVAKNATRPSSIVPKAFPTMNMGQPLSSMKILVDVSQFHADELKVRVSGKDLEVEAKHEEREDEHGRVGRYFIRKYALPDGALTDQIGSSLSEEGILTIEIPKKRRVRAPMTRNVNIPTQKMDKTSTSTDEAADASKGDFASGDNNALSLEDE